MKPEDCELIAQLCAARAGLNVDPEKTYLIESRLGPVARREGFGSIEDLIADLKTRREDRLAWSVVEAMAAGETAFFRAVIEGYRRGKRAAWLHGEDYEALMAEPLDAARRRLGIEPAPAYRIAQARLEAAGLKGI